MGVYYLETAGGVTSISVCPCLPACLPAFSGNFKNFKKLSYVHVPHGERFSNFELFGLQDSYSTVGFSTGSRIPVFLLLLLLLYFFVAAAAFLGIGFWLIRGIGFRGILGFLGF